MRTLLVLLALQFPSAPSGLAIRPTATTSTVTSAAECLAAGVPDHDFVQLNDQGTKVYTKVVPADQVWLIQQVGLFSLGPQIPDPNTEWMIEVIEPVAPYTDSELIEAPGINCCWRMPYHKEFRAFATPVTGQHESYVLRPGQRFAGRTNNSIDFGINTLFIKYPVGCLQALVWGMR